MFFAALFPRFTLPSLRNNMSPADSSQRIQVLVVDDSAVVRQVLHGILSQEADINVTVAADPIFAMQKMAQIRPHVIVLDLEMPRMDGLTFLKKVMAEDPIPTLICSSVATRGTLAAIDAVQEGAVGIITKPKLAVGNFLHDSAVMLIDAVRSAAAARVRPRAVLLGPPKLKPAFTPALYAHAPTGPCKMISI